MVRYSRELVTVVETSKVVYNNGNPVASPSVAVEASSVFRRVVKTQDSRKRGPARGQDDRQRHPKHF